MKEPRISVTLDVETEVRLVPSVLVTDNPEWSGEITADIWFGREHSSATLSFNYGWDKPEVILARIDHLAAALAALRALVVPHIASEATPEAVA